MVFSLAFLTRILIVQSLNTSTWRRWWCGDASNPSLADLGQEGIIGHVSQEVPLAHVLWSDLGGELVQEVLQGLGLGGGVPGGDRGRDSRKVRLGDNRSNT